ncbi:hypothetical protein BCY88_05810 [Paraburkholderia fungorum]|uniref:Uncharacterized protein n=1 Tax=Paraburkholderia fungorum TaxID=134537 RepID=A0A3R7HFZ7_9BURK|nr:hypothetical protein BCY88_05810 [Paraburkholderia fungorum]
MLNLDLGTSYTNVVSLLKDCEISENVFQIDNSCPIRLDISSDEAVIRFKMMEDQSYGWQSDVALLYFKSGNLKSITIYFREKYSYRGLICGKVGLGDEIRDLKEYFALEYDDVDEVFYAFNDGRSSGLELHGTSCDLSVDPAQKIGAMKVFLVD